MKLFGIELKFNGFDIWHKGNQGSGSTMDADTVDGKHASDFATSSHNHTSLRVPDTRDVVDTPVDIANNTLSVAFKSTGAVNDPPVSTGSGFSHILNMNGWTSGNVGGGGHTAQVAIGDGLAIRQSTGTSAWGPWHELWHDGNDGAGSGLDADLLDGKHSSDFATSAQGTKADNALPASSYTASDILTKLKTVDGPGSGLDADTLDGVNVSGLGRAYASNWNFGDSQVAMTTAEFISLLTSLGAFDQPYWVARGSWAYAYNKYISDTGIGNIHLAGCTVEVIGDAWNHTIRIHTPTTSSSGVTHTEYIYVNNGPTYSPGWRKLWNDKNDGAGSGLDADLLDGQHANYFAPASSVPTKLSELTNDIGAGGGIKITTSTVAPGSTSPGDFWYKEG